MLYLDAATSVAEVPREVERGYEEGAELWADTLLP
jgi:hypothetical protein